MPDIILTPRVVSALSSPTRVVFWDTHKDSPPRFGVRVNGKRAVYVVVVGRKWFKIASTRAMGLDDARKQAQVIIGQALRGEPTRRETSQVTLGELIDRYVESRQLAWRTQRKYLVSKAHLGDLCARRANAIVRSDLRAHLDAMASVSARDAVLALLSAAYKFGNIEEMKPDLPLVSRDPTRGIPSLATGKKRTRYLSDPEVRQFWNSLPKLKSTKPAYFKLLLLLALRKTEAVLGEWKEVDLKAATWTIPPEHRKTRAATKHLQSPLVVPLPTQAVAIFADLKARATEERIFKFSTGGGTSEQVRLATGLELSPHDLRRTVAMWLEGQGAAPHVIGQVLGRAPKFFSDADAHYVTGQRLREVREWLQRWADHIENVRIRDILGDSGRFWEP
jgi:integrase